MDSKYLIENGFRRFGEFDPQEIKSREDELNFSGVYAFVLDKIFPRLNGETDIIYIGQTGSIFKRMLNYCDGYEKAPQDKRIKDSLEKIKTMIRIGRALKDKRLNNNVFIFYKNLSNDKCQEEESKLLKKYSNDHIELPPLNRRQ